MKNAITKIIELEIAEYYSRKTREVVFVPVGYFRAFDGVTQSKRLTFECKFEEKASHTGNLCLEYSYKGKPSGLAATQATKWVHVVPLTKERLCCFEFDVEPLREALKGLPIYSAGDRKQSQVKLVPLQRAEQLKTDKFYLTINWSEFRPYW